MMKQRTLFEMTFTFALTAFLLSGTALYGEYVLWTGDGGDNKWETADNWETDSVPVDGDNATIDGGATVEFDATTGDRAVDAWNIGTDGVQDVTNTFNFSGGTLTADYSGSTGIGAADGNDSTFNQTGGTIDSASRLELAYAGGTGTYNLSGGSAEFHNSATVSGTDVLDREFSIRISRTDSTTSGLVEISGGSLTADHGVSVEGSGGTWSVQGGNASNISAGVSGTHDGQFNLVGASTFKAGIDSSGITTTEVWNPNGGGKVTFEADSLLDVGFLDGYSVSQETTWTLLEFENGDITDNGIGFTGDTDTSIWSYNVDNSGSNGILEVTAVPEPSSLALLGLAGLLLMKRRRV